MEYQSLYRRYRPGRFDAVRGQQHVVRALRNAVRDNRVSHLYLLSGPRGTGKTTLARILAKVLNCEATVDGEPCGVCASCLSIEAGNSFDLHELDAASNNRVDDIRDLLSKVALGTPGRTKVYLLDEVHMLSSGAENALLKTLEEPPDHVVFVLATTEPHKVVPTIRSRAQHLELTLLDAEEMAAHVRWVISDAHLEVGDDVVDHVVRAGGGSVRDTLSALDQVVAAGGIAHADTSSGELLEAIASRDAGRAVAAIAEALRLGREPRVIGEGLLGALRNVLLVVLGARSGSLTGAEREQAEVFAPQLSAASLTRALEVVGTALVDMRQAPDPRVDLEVALVRLCMPSADASLASLVDRVAALERQLASGVVAMASGSGVDVPPAAAPTRPVAAASAAPPAPARPSRTEAPPRPARSGPASEARSRLSRSGPSGAPARPAPRDVAPRDSAPDDVAPPVAPRNERPSASSDAEVARAVASSAPSAPPAPVGALDLGSLRGAWDSVLDAMPRKARVRFSGVAVQGVDGANVVVAFPNDVHRSRCEEFRVDVERAIAERFATAVKVRFVTDEAASSRSAGSNSDHDGYREPPAPEAEESIDLAELTDAPKGGGALDQLTSAFPGAELIEGG